MSCSNMTLGPRVEHKMLIHSPPLCWCSPKQWLWWVDYTWTGTPECNLGVGHFHEVACLVTLSSLTKSILHEIWNTAIEKCMYFPSTNLLLNPANRKQIWNHSHQDTSTNSIELNILKPPLCSAQIGQIFENEAILGERRWEGGDEEEIPCYRSHSRQHSNTFASPPHLKKVIMQWFENTEIREKENSWPGLDGDCG